MKRLGFLAMALVLSALCGCLPFLSVTGSGNITEKTYRYAAFTRVQAGATFHVTVRYAPKASVSVSVDDNLVDTLDVSVAGDALLLSLAPGTWYRNCTIRAVVELPLLQEITMSGASTGLVEKGFPLQKSFAASVSGASVLTVSGFEADAVTCAVSGASRATIAGTAVSMRAVCSGASRMIALDCPVQEATVDVDGASTVSAAITAGGSLSYALSGASTLYYQGGSVVLTRRESSGASILQRLY